MEQSAKAKEMGKTTKTQAGWPLPFLRGVEMGNRRTANCRRRKPKEVGDEAMDPP